MSSVSGLYKARSKALLQKNKLVNQSTYEGFNKCGEQFMTQFWIISIVHESCCQQTNIDYPTNHCYPNIAYKMCVYTLVNFDNLIRKQIIFPFNYFSFLFYKRVLALSNFIFQYLERTLQRIFTATTLKRKKTADNIYSLCKQHYNIHIIMILHEIPSILLFLARHVKGFLLSAKKKKRKQFKTLETDQYILKRKNTFNILSRNIFTL